MKISKFLLVGMVFSSFMPAIAEQYEAGGIVYDLKDDNTASVASFIEGNDIVIPSTVTNNDKTYKVTKIDKYAAYYGMSITGMTIGENVTEIADSAFMQAYNIKYFNLPASLKTIAPTAFAWMRNTETITVPESSQHFKLVDGGLLTKDGKEMVLFPCKTSGSYTVPEGVEVIRDYSFFGSSLNSITLPSTVNSIGDLSFSYSALSSFVIPASVQTIGESAFIGSSDLTDLQVASGNLRYRMQGQFMMSVDNKRLVAVQYPLPSELTIPDGVEYIGDYMFKEEKALNKVVLPNSCKRIGEESFAYCVNITDFDFGAGLESIGTQGLRECTSLTSVSLPATIKSIALQSFLRCYALTYVTLPEGLQTIGPSSFDFCTSLKSVDIPNSVTSINFDSFYAWGQTFSDCTSLEHVTIGTGITELPRVGFTNCKALKDIHIPSNVKNLGGVCFANSGLENITFDEGLEVIETSAFASIPAQSVVLPNSVRSVGQTVFAQSPNLESVTFGTGLREMVDFAVFDCPKLTEIIMPEGLETFPSAGYCMCPGVTSLTFPASISNYGDQALMVMDGLTDLTIMREDPANVSGELFDDLSKYDTVTLHVKAGSVEAYRDADVWKKFTNIVGDAQSDVEEINIDDAASRTIVGIYDMTATRRSELGDGVNIVVYSDGTRTKVMR